MKKALTALAAVGLLAAVPALAQTATPPADPPPPATPPEASGDSLTIGVGAAYLPDYEGSNDYHWRPAPGAIGSYRGFRFQLAGNQLSVDLIPDRSASGWDVALGPIAVVDFNRSSIKSIRDPRVKALGQLGTAIELGGYAGIAKTGVITSAYDRLSVSVGYRTDISGVHRSDIIEPAISYFTPLSRKAAAGLFGSATHVGAGYGRTYYSVTPAQSLASGLPVFAARGGWRSYSLGALGTIALTGDLLHGWKLVAGGTYTRLLGDFAASPLVSVAGSRAQWLGAVGVAYTFGGRGRR